MNMGSGVCVMMRMKNDIISRVITFQWRKRGENVNESEISIPENFYRNKKNVSQFHFLAILIHFIL